MYAFKLVSKEEGKYFSSCSPPQVRVKYRLGERIVPEVGRLFVFKDLEMANIFKDNLHLSTGRNIRVFYGKAEKARPKKTIIALLADMTPLKVRKFWKRSVKKISVACSPKGTYTCSAFTPLGEII